LLEQLEDYADQFASGKLRDPLLRLLGHPGDAPLGEAERALILERCFRANHERMILPFPAYKGLHDLFAAVTPQGEDSFHYLSDQYFLDLVTWYHLCWTGETVRRTSEALTRLMTKGARFSYADRMDLLKLIGGLVGGVVPRYARLAESGRIELSTTPHFHPLAPLLISLASARDAVPEIKLPISPEYPGGYERVDAQLRAALEGHGRRFGRTPAGIWPAEGAISREFLALLGSRSCKWTASGGQVLLNSLRGAGAPQADPRRALYRPYRVADTPGPVIFFRDDRLSDLIGFEYAKWNSHDAAAHFVAALEEIAPAAEGEAPLVSVILDGENCWEYYPYNGYYFLSELYRLLESHAVIRTTTFQSYLDAPAAEPARLERIVAGSWVYGNFTTWIGSPEKNHAWDLLCAAKHSFDTAVAGGRLGETQAQAAFRQLASCEASDWFWWMGDYNPQFAVANFDALYRANLANLYRLLKLEAPAGLTLPISQGHGEPEAGGAMRRSTASAQPV
jgi:alpha-amylase/alpha-mannosidase (GH57 family)